MPFSSNDQLPKGVKGLPEHLQNMWRKVFNSAYEGNTCKEDADKDACASKVAWSRVSQERNKSLVEFSMVITKAALDPNTGEMRWSAVCSDTDEDSYQERMSLRLFNSFVRNAANKIAPPPEHCSTYWRGGMPYLSVAHYKDQDGYAVPGVVKKLYIDGNRLKASGIFLDTPLGRAAFKAVRESRTEGVPEDERVRISIGFLDFEHSHGEAVFRRRSNLETCPLCMEGAGQKQYLDGLLVHLAMTKVPVNKRTEMEVERSMADIRTRKDDAASIVGEELAEELDKRAQTSVMRSEAEPELDLVVKSEEPVQEVKSEGTETSVEAKTVEAPVEKSDSPEVDVQKMETSVAPVAMQMPFGGATTFDAYDSWASAQEEKRAMFDTWYTFEALASNILMDDSVTDKKSQMSKLLSDCKKRLETKALVALSKLADEKPAQVVEKSEPATHPLDEQLSQLKAQYDEVLKSENPAVEKLQAIQPVFAALGEQIKSQIEASEVKQPASEVAAASPASDTSEIVKSLVDQLRPLQETIAELKQTVAQLTSQQSAVKATTEVKSLVPPRRNLASDPNVAAQIQKSVIGVKPEASQTPKLRSMIRKSVGLQ